MQLLIALRNGAALVDPQQRVLDTRVRRGLVHAHADRELVLPRGVLQAAHERAGGEWLGEGDGFLRARGDVVGGFGEEEGLAGLAVCVCWWHIGDGIGCYLCARRDGLAHERLALREILREDCFGAELPDCLFAISSEKSTYGELCIRLVSSLLSLCFPLLQIPKRSYAREAR